MIVGARRPLIAFNVNLHGPIEAAREIADRTARTAATAIVVDEVRALESRRRPPVKIVLFGLVLLGLLGIVALATVREISTSATGGSKAPIWRSPEQPATTVATWPSVTTGVVAAAWLVLAATTRLTRGSCSRTMS